MNSKCVFLHGVLEASKITDIISDMTNMTIVTHCNRCLTNLLISGDISLKKKKKAAGVNNVFKYSREPREI